MTGKWVIFSPVSLLFANASDEAVWQFHGNDGVAVIESILVVFLPVSAVPRCARVHDRNGKFFSPQSACSSSGV